MLYHGAGGAVVGAAGSGRFLVWLRRATATTIIIAIKEGLCDRVRRLWCVTVAFVALFPLHIF